MLRVILLFLHFLIRQRCVVYSNEYRKWGFRTWQFFYYSIIKILIFIRSINTSRWFAFISSFSAYAIITFKQGFIHELFNIFESFNTQKICKLSVRTTSFKYRRKKTTFHTFVNANVSSLLTTLLNLVSTLTSSPLHVRYFKKLSPHENTHIYYPHLGDFWPKKSQEKNDHRAPFSRVSGVLHTNWRCGSLELWRIKIDSEARIIHLQRRKCSSYLFTSPSKWYETTICERCIVLDRSEDAMRVCFVKAMLMFSNDG